MRRIDYTLELEPKNTVEPNRQRIANINMSEKCMRIWTDNDGTELCFHRIKF